MRNERVKCELDSLHASEAWDEGLEWESYQFGRTVISKSAGIEHELEYEYCFTVSSHQ